MNFSLPVNEEQTRIKLVKKEDLAARKEAKKPLFTSGANPTNGGPTGAETSRAMPAGGAPPSSGAPNGAALPNGASITATVMPAPQATEPKVQLLEVEPGVYDIYFTCSCCEQYVIRCESIEKAAASPPSAS